MVVERNNQGSACLIEQSLPLSFLLEGNFNLLAFGHVAEIADNCLDLGIMQVIGAGSLQPDPRAVLMARTIFHGNLSAGRLKDLCQLARDRVSIIGMKVAEN